MFVNVVNTDVEMEFVSLCSIMQTYVTGWNHAWITEYFWCENKNSSLTQLISVKYY